MNDCLWYGIGVCGGVICKCPRYLSLNSEEGNQMGIRYDMEIQDAMKPVRERWGKMLTSGEWEVE